jgi:hypothetical protein
MTVDVEQWMREHHTAPQRFCAADTWGWSPLWCQFPPAGHQLPADVTHALLHGETAGRIPGTLEAGMRRHHILMRGRQWPTREAAVLALAAALADLGRS